MTHKEARWLAENALDEAEEIANYDVIDKKLRAAIINCFAKAVKKRVEINLKHRG